MFRSIFIWTTICLCISSAAENYRLPLDISPQNYQLKLTPYLLEYDGNKRFTFDGDVQITVKVINATNKILLHTKSLNYTTREYWMVENPSVKLALTNYEHNNVTDIITYTTQSRLEGGKSYVLHFVYAGKMEDDMHGFYRSSYVDSQNNTIWLGTTQFETYHARRAFPCFDEPRFKATFDITLIRHVSMNTYANTRIINSTTNGFYATDVYSTTPKMSTYLVAFIFSNFGHRFDGSFGIIARQEFYSQSEYSFEVGKKILSALDEYFGLKYYETGNNKMDMAAIPDFSAGAMENWGLLTYRERNLLYQENFTTLSAKQAIATAIAHEQTHMWFGDLVTCQWWSYSWLQEGFANYFQHFATSRVEKHFQLDAQFVTTQLQTVMQMDSTNLTHSMSDENTNTPEDITRMFNSISYNKGAVVIRMVNHIIDEENFQKSLQEYLNTYKYTNIIPENLFTIWKKYWPTEFANYADPFFASFTTQVGYPLVHINVSSDGKSFEVSQKRFLLKEYDGANATLLYTIPFTYTTNIDLNFTDTKPKMFLQASKEKFVVQLDSNITWIIANIQVMGYYRVNYNIEHWHKIHHALYENNWSSIHEQNRAQIVDDLFNLARANVTSYDLALAVLEYLETETHYEPWAAAFNGYNYLAIRLDTNTAQFGAYIQHLTQKAYKQLGFEDKANDTTLNILNRVNILSWSCKYGNSNCVSKARAYFNKKDVTPIPVNIRSVVYCSVMRDGNELNYDKLVDKFKTENVNTEQYLILSALGCVRDSKLVEKHFWFIVGNDVRRQDKSSALSSLYTANNENVSPVFKLVTDNCDKLAEAMGGYSDVASVIFNIAAHFTKESQNKNLEDFNKANAAKFGSASGTLTAAEVTVKENLAWTTNNLKYLTNYLRNFKSGAASLSLFTAI